MAETGVLAVVLAGGLGSRLGGEKALAEIAGRPLVSYVVGAAVAAGLETVVAAKPDTELPRLPGVFLMIHLGWGWGLCREAVTGLRPDRRGPRPLAPEPVRAA